MAGWQAISVRVAKADVAALETLFEENAALAITISSGEQTQEIFDVLDQQYRLWRFVKVCGLFEQNTELDAIFTGLADYGLAKDDIETFELADQDWVARWQQDQRPLDFGHGLFICPPNVEPPPSAEQIVLLEPGMAFGTGTHPTTSMCLQWIAAHPWQARKTMIDFGCGSGVLAIAAAKCGAGDIYACDVDPQALAVARANADLNQLTQILFCANGDLPAIEVDVLIANILLEPLILEKRLIHRHLKAGGELVMSGILSDQTDRLIKAYAAEFSLEVTMLEQDWALLVGEKLR